MQTFRSYPDTIVEVSLGVLDQKTKEFTVGVQFDYFKALYTAFSESKAWSDVDTKSHSATYEYKGSVKGYYNVKDKPTFYKIVQLQ